MCVVFRFILYNKTTSELTFQNVALLAYKIENSRAYVDVVQYKIVNSRAFLPGCVIARILDREVQSLRGCSLDRVSAEHG